MPKFTGDKEWRVEEVPPSPPDAPLPGIWVRAWRDGDPVEAGPAWTFATEAEEADARAQAAAIALRRNDAEALAAAKKEA